MSSLDSHEGSGDLTARRLQLLLRAALTLVGEHDVDQILRHVVEAAAALAGARYSALGTYDAAGGMERFVYHGVGEATVAQIGRLPEGLGLLGEVIVADGPIRLDDLATHKHSAGFPPGHPSMRSFLGVPVRRGARRFGNLYLTEKADGTGFDEDDERLMVILAAFAGCALEGALLVVAERERGAARSELATAQERGRLGQEMLSAVLSAQEAERARVARDLHDQIGQALTSVLLALRLVETSLGQEDGADVAGARLRTAEARELVNDALHDARQLAFELRPTLLDDVGLVAALQRLTGDVATRNDVTVDLSVDGLAEDDLLPEEVATVVYRVVQEALTNVVRHARAGRAQVSVARDGAWVRAAVTDDGAGFDPGAAAGRSLGLLGMRERAGLVGGRVEVVSAPGAGTTVRLEVPLA